MKNEIARREIESLDYYLQNHINDYSEESHTAMMMAIKALEHEPRWIPVSERLPKEGRKIYLTCFQDGYMATIMLGSDGKWLIEGEEPIAWMPLPESYKEESEDKE